MNLSMLQVSMVPHLLASPQNQLRVDLTVHNNFDHAVTVQVWDSPLDPQCALLGVIEILDKTNNTSLPIDRVYFSRQMPPPPESFVQIDSHSKIMNLVLIPDIGMIRGRDYRLQAKGSWKTVWGDAMDKIDADSLSALAGASTGEFASNIAEIKL